MILFPLKLNYITHILDQHILICSFEICKVLLIRKWND